MMARSFLLTGMALVLAACVPATQMVPASPTKAAQSSAVGPGPDPADPISASILFSEVCTDTAPSFKKAPAALSKIGFRQHPTTGTYYHPNLDLSIKLMTKRCSMVFASKGDPSSLALMMAGAAPKHSADEGLVDLDAKTARSTDSRGTLFEFSPLPLNDGSPMYRAVLIAR